MDLNELGRGGLTLAGILLVSLGVAGFDWRFGLITLGVLLLLSVKTAWNWIK